MAFPIMGVYFRPLAKSILAALSANTCLVLCPEPENEYDPNAIKIILLTEEFPEETLPALEDSLAHAGKDLDDFFAEPEWHLGYVPRGITAIMAPELAGRDRPAWLRFSPEGKPEVTTTDPTEKQT